MKIDDEKIKTIVERRYKIAIDYCIAKGWPTEPGELSFEQIDEIRQLDSWINVTKEFDTEQP